MMQLTPGYINVIWHRGNWQVQLLALDPRSTATRYRMRVEHVKTGQTERIHNIYGPGYPAYIPDVPRYVKDAYRRQLRIYRHLLA